MLKRTYSTVWALVAVLIALLTAASACMDPVEQSPYARLQLGANSIEAEAGAGLHLVWIFPSGNLSPLYEDLVFSVEPEGAATLGPPDRVYGRYFGDGMSMTSIGQIDMRADSAEVRISPRNPLIPYSGFPALLQEE